MRNNEKASVAVDKQQRGNVREISQTHRESCGTLKTSFYSMK